MTQHYHGYSGKSYDRWVERNSNSSAFGKVQKQFWFTKSAVMRKLGKREDEYIVASDAELDSKIDLFKAIEESTRELQILLAEYQNKICVLAQEENTLGRLLKEYGKQDQTRAGKMMTAVGKSLSYTAQQRVALRNPLVRLFQEVDTFQSRAVEDTCHTVEEMEKVRTEYRGALMWMKNISQDFNPDHYQQLEKFREVQTLVKQKKSKFDQIKIKSLQKIELLAASRCNMFSHALILYQNNLITFSEKTAKTLNSVASNFKGYQPYKFHVIKELAEPEGLMENEEPEKEDTDLEGDDKTFFSAEYHDEVEDKSTQNSSNVPNNRADKEKKREKTVKNSDSLVNLFNTEETNPLLSIENQYSADENCAKNEMKSMTTSFADVDLLSDDVTDMTNASTEDMLKELFDSPLREVPAGDQTLPVFEIASSNTEDDSLSQKKVFDMPEKDFFSCTNPPSSSSSSQIFMPSHLLDFGLKGFDSLTNIPPPHPLTTQSTSSFGTAPAAVGSKQPLLSPSPLSLGGSHSPAGGPSSSTRRETQGSSPSGKSSSSQLSKQKAKLDWYKVFQDIDPLADPGSAIFGKGVEDKKC